MLHKLDLVYDDGTEETKIFHTVPGEQVKIYPERDKIHFSNHKVFKYEFPEHEGLVPVIVKLGGVKKIMPWGVECHPKTTLDDIRIIKKRKNKPTQKKTWKFESASGGGTYKVTTQYGKLKCDCMGFWRSKGNCKHVKEVRLELGES